MNTKKVSDGKKTVEVVDSTLQLLSSSFNAKVAMTKFSGFKTIEEVDAYIKNEERQTVLSRAQSRKNAILKGL